MAASNKMSNEVLQSAPIIANTILLLDKSEVKWKWKCVNIITS